MACVADNFCDKFGEVSSVSLLLTKAEKDQRGKLLVSRGCGKSELKNSENSARNRLGIGLSYRPARQHCLAELVPSYRFWGSLKVLKERTEE